MITANAMSRKADGAVAAWGDHLSDQCVVPPATYALAPKAKIAPVTSAHPGKPLSLDGSGSSDPDNYVPLTYAWQIAQKLAGSNPTLANPTAVAPTFTPDAAILANYKVLLVVRDNMGVFSNPVWASLSTQNAAPVADAGPDQAITVVGSTVFLNGLTPSRASYDPDGDPLAFQWTFVSWPGSTDSPPAQALTSSEPIPPLPASRLRCTATISCSWR
jgi:hypothetical protein